MRLSPARGVRNILSSLFIKPLGKNHDRKIFYGSMGKTYKGFPAYIKAMRENRDPHAKGAPDIADFGQVLEHWGLTEDQIPRVVRGLAIEAALLFLFGAYGGYMIVTGGSLLPRICGTSMLIMGLVGFVTRFWRIQVLKTRQFIFFKHWITGSWGDWGA